MGDYFDNSYACDVCIVGLGPAGIGCVSTFFGSEIVGKTVCLDAGPFIKNRLCSAMMEGKCIHDMPCKIISGFGGSALIGGGKISSFPAGSGMADILGSREKARTATIRALDVFSKYVKLQKPHTSIEDIKTAVKYFNKLGFKFKYYDSYIYDQEELRIAYQSIFLQLQQAGVKLLLESKLLDVQKNENEYRLAVKRGSQIITIRTKNLVLGIGKAGLNLLEDLCIQYSFRKRDNHLDVGVRIEFPADIWPDINKFHNDLKLLFNNSRTFCVCDNGKVVPYCVDDTLFVEGCLNQKIKSGLTNMGILVRLEPSKNNKVVYGEIKKRLNIISKHKLIRQNLHSYLGAYSIFNEDIKFIDSNYFWLEGNVNKCFPQHISGRIHKAVEYFASRLLPRDRWEEIFVYAPEVGYSGESYQVGADFSIVSGMYLIGDCTGRFRGILQAFCSGIICAESIIGEKYD